MSIKPELAWDMFECCWWSADIMSSLKPQPAAFLTAFNTSAQTYFDFILRHLFDKNNTKKKNNDKNW